MPHGLGLSVASSKIHLPIGLHIKNKIPFAKSYLLCKRYFMRQSKNQKWGAPRKNATAVAFPHVKSVHTNLEGCSHGSFLLFLSGSHRGVRADILGSHSNPVRFDEAAEEQVAPLARKKGDPAATFLLRTLKPDL